MTKAEAVNKAMASYDRHCEEATWKSVTAMILDGVPDWQIQGALQFGLELQAQDRPAHRRRIEQEIDKADEWFRRQAN